MPNDDWMYPMDIAKKLGVRVETVSRIARRKGYDIDRSGGYHKPKYRLSDITNGILSAKTINLHNRRFFNPVSTKDFTDYWQLSWNECIITADFHVPFVHEKLFDRMLEVAEHWKIKNFLHAGDFFDQNQFSIFDTYQEDLVQWEDEIECARNVYLTLTKSFDDIRFFMGSHDLRFWKILNHSGKATNFNSAYKQAKIPEENTSRYRYAQLGSEWHITHPRNVIRINTAPALRLGAKYERSLVFGHGHWWGIYRDPSGRHYQVAPGCMTDQRKHAYTGLWDTSHDKWTPGFLVIVEGSKPILFSHDSPWEVYLGSKHPNPNHKAR